MSSVAPSTADSIAASLNDCWLVDGHGVVKSSDEALYIQIGDRQYLLAISAEDVSGVVLKLDTGLAIKDPKPELSPNWTVDQVASEESETWILMVTSPTKDNVAYLYVFEQLLKLHPDR